MHRHIHRLASAAVLCAASGAVAAEWPAALMVEGVPITRCLEALSSRADAAAPLPLAGCMAGGREASEAEPMREWVDQGFIGTHTTDGAYSYYKVIGRYRGGFVVYGVSSAGGTARFSSLDVVKRKKDTVWLDREIAGGDRCNGGITEAWMERGKLFYKIHMTPHDMIAYSGVPGALKEPTDLESSASSCFAVGTFVQTSENQPELMLTTLNQDETDRLISDSEWLRTYRYQTCFNKQFLDAISAGNVALDKKALQSWVQGFYAACVHPGTAVPPVDAVSPPLEPPVVLEEIRATPDDGAIQEEMGE